MELNQSIKQFCNQVQSYHGSRNSKWDKKEAIFILVSWALASFSPFEFGGILSLANLSLYDMRCGNLMKCLLHHFSRQVKKSNSEPTFMNNRWLSHTYNGYLVTWVKVVEFVQPTFQLFNFAFETSFLLQKRIHWFFQNSFFHLYLTLSEATVSKRYTASPHSE